MSQLSEQKRITEMNTKQKELSAQDRYVARAAERDVKSLSKDSDMGIDKLKSEADGRFQQTNEELANLDDLTRMKIDPEFSRLSDWMGLDTADFEDGKDRLSTIMEWAREHTRSKDILDVIGLLKRVKSDLGFKEIGATALKKFYMYARLDMDDKRIQKEKALLRERKR